MGVKEELGKLVHPSCLGIAMVAQTAAILSVTAATWTLMYFYSPSKSLRVRFPGLNNAYMRVEYFIQRQVDGLPYRLRNSKVIDWNRVVTSGAEAWILRKPLIPFTYAYSIAVGVFVGTRFYDWRFGAMKEDNTSNDHENWNMGNIDDNMGNDKDNEMMFGWNKIERSPSTDNWERDQYK